MKHLRLVPLTLADANQIVLRWHRHHRPVVGARWSVGVEGPDGLLRGAAIVGRPVCRRYDQGAVCEVTRLVTDGTPHACSMLYASCARAADAMGFAEIQTYILATEPGTSLIAAGWTRGNETTGKGWNDSGGVHRTNTHQLGLKVRWFKRLSAAYYNTRPVAGGTIM